MKLFEVWCEKWYKETHEINMNSNKNNKKNSIIIIILLLLCLVPEEPLTTEILHKSEQWRGQPTTQWTQWSPSSEIQALLRPLWRNTN